VISGFCEIGKNCFLGVNSTIINNISIAEDCFIGASALIQKNTKAGEVYQSQSTSPAKADAFRLFRL
jgi:carbonic anhydrase/acetyltransferase-like protein (isoleucine patch superfamily)